MSNVIEIKSSETDATDLLLNVLMDTYVQDKRDFINSTARFRADIQTLVDLLPKAEDAVGLDETQLGELIYAAAACQNFVIQEMMMIAYGEEWFVLDNIPREIEEYTDEIRKECANQPGGFMGKVIEGIPVLSEYFKRGFLNKQNATAVFSLTVVMVGSALYACSAKYPKWTSEYFRKLDPIINIEFV